jgi:hypothetical protein
MNIFIRKEIVKYMCIKKIKEVKNYTPHDINIILDDCEIIIESEGIARCNEIIEKQGEVLDVEIIKKKFQGVEGLPEERDDTIYIVSLVVAQSCKDRNDLVIPGEIVRDDAGKIIGCKNLAII